MNRNQEKYLKKLAGWCGRAQAHCDIEIPADKEKMFRAYSPSCFWDGDRGSQLVQQLFHVLLGFDCTVGLKNHQGAKRYVQIVWTNLVWHMSVMGSYEPCDWEDIEAETMRAIRNLGQWATKRHGEKTFSLAGV